MDNYQYCAEYARGALADTSQAKVLDFGCGAGQVVELLRATGVSAYGCDASYGGGAYAIPDELSEVILPMQGKEIPFPAEMFDVVVNNQVMEHVVDLDSALSEIHRVLKPGGSCLVFFLTILFGAKAIVECPSSTGFPKVAPRESIMHFACVVLDLAISRMESLACSGRGISVTGWIGGRYIGHMTI